MDYDQDLRSAAEIPEEELEDIRLDVLEETLRHDYAERVISWFNDQMLLASAMRNLLADQGLTLDQFKECD